jgi:TetR/AcrR family transcriptional repressor of nem operon
MPWNKSHKEKTREKILDAAAAAFRTRGVAGAALTEVMRRVGLTHGGFYAHFKSKDELIAAALKFVNAIRLARFKEVAAKSPEGSQLAAAVDIYLSSRHREHPENGCSIATLGSELVREDGKARHQMNDNVRAWLELFSQFATGANAKDRMRQATGTFAAMIGGIILARCTEDPHESDRILADVRAFLHENQNPARMLASR